jgi:3-hydroxy acid dehydrogenase / malonic semialdehyde reductase
MFARTYFVGGLQTLLYGPLLSSPRLLRTMASSAVAKRLEGKTIVVTGASSGIGRSTAFEFARTAPKNLKLILTARRVDTLKEVAAAITKEVGDGVKVLPVKLDVSNADEVRQFVPNLPEEFKDINVLVNNAYGTRICLAGLGLWNFQRC